MQRDYNGYNTGMKILAQQLRKNATPQENKLWYQYLRSYPLPFKRQRIVAHRFIADFYCAKAGLVIELDGSQHFTADGMRYDAIRTEDIEKFHLQVLRFTNAQIDREFPAVCAMIDKTVKERLSP